MTFRESTRFLEGTLQGCCQSTLPPWADIDLGPSVRSMRPGRPSEDRQAHAPAPVPGPREAEGQERGLSPADHHNRVGPKLPDASGRIGTPSGSVTSLITLILFLTHISLYQARFMGTLVLFPLWMQKLTD